MWAWLDGYNLNVRIVEGDNLPLSFKTDFSYDMSLSKEQTSNDL